MILEIIAGGERGKKYDLAARKITLVGRDSSAHIRIENDECSRQHARITRDGERFVIEDLGSRNGLFINRKRCAKAHLAPGDEIRVGNTMLRVSGIGDSVRRSEMLTLYEGKNSVLVTLPPDEADLLNRAAAPAIFDEAGHEREILRQLCEISQIASASNDTQTVLTLILDRIRTILNTDAACILTSSDDGGWVIHAASNPDPDTASISISRTIIQQTIREGAAILATDLFGDPRFATSQSILMQGVASAICSPLKVRDTFVGVLFIDRRHEKPAFTALDLRFAATVGNLISMLIEKEQMHTEARQRERLATIGEVMAGLAHCIKNIIMTLWLSTDSIRFNLNAGKCDDAKASLEILSSQTQRISDLVLDMLSYAKERVPVRTKVDLHASVENAAIPYRQDFERHNICFHIAAAENCPHIQAEDNALQRVFHNLFTNAIDAIASKKDATARDISVTIQPHPDQRNVELRFRDTGAGIPASQLGKIFDVFFSTKGSKGTGLGLAVVHKIITEHGGAVTVDSRENEWSEFRITLPVDVEKVPDMQLPAHACG